MGKQFDGLQDSHAEFIAAQQIYFVGTAAPDGRVNISPKGMDSLRVLGPNRILWLNFTGSGNETAGHLRRSPRMTLMWCSFSTRPLILRAYGTARMLTPGQSGWTEALERFDAPDGARQIYDQSIDLVQSSCGYGVPFFEHAGDRDTLRHWSVDKGPDGLRDYWATRNARTIDGMPTGIEANLQD